jgi:hypothetical protein
MKRILGFDAEEKTSVTLTCGNQLLKSFETHDVSCKVRLVEVTKNNFIIPN